MNTEAVLNPSAADMLNELAALGMRAARVVVAIMEIEHAAAAVTAGFLPAVGPEPVSLAQAVAVGQALDGIAEVMAAAVPRVEGLARALDRVSRSVRRSQALVRRMEAGWPRTTRADDRGAMERRQVARAVGEAIRRQADGEAAERLFDELAERLGDPELGEEIGCLPVGQIVRRICCELGLVMERVQAAVDGPPGGDGVDSC